MITNTNKAIKVGVIKYMYSLKRVLEVMKPLYPL